jgi:hypothetical protein
VVSILEYKKFSIIYISGIQCENVEGCTIEDYGFPMNSSETEFGNNSLTIKLEENVFIQNIYINALRINSSGN